MLELKDILTSVIHNSGQRLAQEKIAQDMGKKTDESKAIAAQAKREVKEEDVNMGAEKTAYAYVEKVASAVEYVVDNINDILPKGPLARALDKVANKPGAGAGSLDVSQSGKPSADYAKKDKMFDSDDPSSPRAEKGPQGKTKDTLDKRPGGPLLSKEPFINSPSGTSKEAALAVVLSKLAGEDVMKAHIKASSSKNPGALESWEANQSPGTPMGHDQSGYGNDNERYIMSNQAAIDYTKANAKKEYIKSQLGQVFDNSNPASDTALDRAWTRGRNTAKIAGLNKEAILGPLADLHQYALPSVIGYHAGKEEGRSMARHGKPMDERSIAGALLMPGALGYRHGKEKGYEAEQERSSSQKTAFMHPTQLLTQAVGTGAVNGLGYVLGSDKGKEMARRGEKIDDRSDLAAVFVPGHTGYRYGKTKSYDEELDKMSKKAQLKLAEAVEQGCVCDGEGSCSYCKAKNAVMKKLAGMHPAFQPQGGAPISPVDAIMAHTMMQRKAQQKLAGMDGAAGAVPGGEDPSVAAAAGPGGPPPPGGPQVPPPPDCQCGGQGQCLPCKKAQLAMIMAQAKAQGGPGGAPPPGGPPDAGGGALPPEQPQAM